MNKFKQLLQEGIDLLKKKMFEEAIASLTEATGLAPSDEDNAIAYFHRGRAFAGKGEVDLAIVDFSRAIEISPTHELAYQHRGKAFESKLNYLRAIEDYDHAIRLNSRNATTYNFRGYCQGQQGHSASALSDFDAAIAIDSKFGAAYTNRGVAYHRLGNFQHAIVDFDIAIKIDAQDAHAYIGRAASYIKLGKLERALEDSNKAIELAPDIAAAYSNRAAVYVDLEEFSKAIEDANKALKLDPRNAVAFVNRGQAYTRLKEFDKAIHDFNEALRVDPKLADADANRTLAFSLKHASESEKNFKALYEKEVEKIRSSLLEDVDQLFRRGEEFKEREDEYSKKLSRANLSLSGAILALFALFAGGGWAILSFHFDKPQAASQDFLPLAFGLLPYIAIMLIVASPIAWLIRIILRNIQKLEILREDYFRKRILARYVSIASEDLHFRNFMLYETMRHFSQNGGADLLVALSEGGRKTQREEMNAFGKTVLDAYFNKK